MMNYLSLGPVPAEEHCEQVGTPGYSMAGAKQECRRFIAAIRAVCGHEPDGAILAITNNPHDFGFYYDVVVKFDDSNQEAIDYAFAVESNLPGTWEEAGV
jgi:hypothetical protein